MLWPCKDLYHALIGLAAEEFVAEVPVPSIASNARPAVTSMLSVGSDSPPA
ncbi:MAG: hypothetical protein PHY41_05460 [Candidatus Cloacimonetes bacterium]|nr:hypothetical protein [Candidatus Cloacimonadota bacterium]